mmetsp:Transcript_61676/g.169630  ORF Transcript_61676/g.169630 Transcript_61676/m.169630 type:complete len:259 (+) Transcript_61676:110-886(+)
MRELAQVVGQEIDERDADDDTEEPAQDNHVAVEKGRAAVCRAGRPPHVLALEGHDADPGVRHRGDDPWVDDVDRIRRLRHELTPRACCVHVLVEALHERDGEVHAPQAAGDADAEEEQHMHKRVAADIIIIGLSRVVVHDIVKVVVAVLFHPGVKRSLGDSRVHEHAEEDEEYDSRASAVGPHELTLHVMNRIEPVVPFGEDAACEEGKIERQRPEGDRHRDEALRAHDDHYRLHHTEPQPMHTHHTNRRELHHLGVG